MNKTSGSDDGHEVPKDRVSSKLFSAMRVVFINIVIFVILAEIVSIGFVHWKGWPGGKPTYGVNTSRFWVDINPAFGVWHQANSRFLHQEGCFNVEYTSNSYGARDKERSVHATKPRAIMLGDSFVEGWGLPDDERLSNVMEHDTGREYLNFGVSGNFGPLQYALVYKTLASNFDHKDVLVGILPDNDFLDMNLDYYKSIGQGERYRPYYAPDMKIFYTGHFNPNPGEAKKDLDAVISSYSALYHVARYLYSVSGLYWKTRGIYSGYNDYDQTDLKRLDAALMDIKATADSHHAKAYVFLIPRANDFLRFHQTGSNRLGPAMEQWGRDHGLPVLDLLPRMDAASGGKFLPYFQSCDGHWSPLGARAAAGVLERWLSDQHADIAANAAE